GHAATAPPNAASNSRRPMVTVIRPSRARCVKGTIPRHERVVLTFKEGTMLVASTSVVGFNCTTSAPSPSRMPPSRPRPSACGRASACDPREAECDQVVMTTPRAFVFCCGGDTRREKALVAQCGAEMRNGETFRQKVMQYQRTA